MTTAIKCKFCFVHTSNNVGNNAMDVTDKIEATPLEATAAAYGYGLGIRAKKQRSRIKTGCDNDGARCD